MYTLFRSLATRKKPSDLPIANLLKLAAAHYHPKPSLAVQRFRFNSRTCQAEESVTAHLAELKRLPEHCSFGDSLDDTLQDRIACGIQDQQTQRRLLAEPDLTLKRAFEVGTRFDTQEGFRRRWAHKLRSCSTPAQQKCMLLALNSDCFERRYLRALPLMIVHRHRLIATRCSLIHLVPL